MPEEVFVNDDVVDGVDVPLAVLDTEGLDEPLGVPDCDPEDTCDAEPVLLLVATLDRVEDCEAVRAPLPVDVAEGVRVPEEV